MSHWGMPFGVSAYFEASLWINGSAIVIPSDLGLGLGGDFALEAQSPTLILLLDGGLLRECWREPIDLSTGVQLT